MQRTKPGISQWAYWGVFTPTGYFVDEASVEEFDKIFPYKEKVTLPEQIFLNKQSLPKQSQVLDVPCSLF